jgi:hypothetical protein
MPVDAGMEQFAKDLIADPADVEWVLSKWVPHPLAAWTQPLRIDNPAAAALPRAFIYCTESKGTAGEDFTVAAAERVQSDPAWTYLELAANHMVLVNDPEATAEALLALV